MRARIVPIIFAAAASFAASPTVTAQEDSPPEKAMRLANQGDVDGAIQILNGYLGMNAKDAHARVVLGRLLDFDGRPDEAVVVWEEGLTDAASDLPLLMSIGEVRRRQGTDGPTVSYRRGMVGVKPSKDEAEEGRYKRSHLAQAAAAYEKARKLRPDDPEAGRALASVYSGQERHDLAAEVWKSLVEREPRNGENYLNLGLETRKAGRADEASRLFERAIELDPRLAEAHEALADIQERRGRVAEAEESRKRANFYKRLPPFCTLAYSEGNLKTLDTLNEEGAVRKLKDDPTEPAAEFLAALCWSHPHNPLETQAFDALEARGAGTTPLLRSLLDAAHSTCTIRSTAHILARRKSAGMFDYLVQRLPADVRGFGMDMDIAGSLDDLGDPRAVGPLKDVLAPGVDGAGRDGGPLADRDSARARAALALGAFDTPEARRVLDAGEREPRIAPYCSAALYRLTKDPKRLAGLEKAVDPGDGYTTYLVGNYLINKVGTDQAKALARTWEQRRKARRADDETRSKKEAAP